MPPIKALVLCGYGLNCDYETQFALAQAGAEAVRVHINELICGEARLTDVHLLALVGGFSWGDDHGAGVILGLRLKLALQSQLIDFIQDGKLILGICNGFQVLVNMGLLPGLNGDYNRRQVAMIPNDCGNFRDAWVHLQVASERSVFTRHLNHLELPVRHGEGKFFAPPEVRAELFARQQVVFQYATPEGHPAHGRFPDNPNGSLDDIAGICDPSGRVLGLMPHPEAYIQFTQHPTWTRQKETWRRQHQPPPSLEGAGMHLFRNAITYLQATFGTSSD